MVESKVEEVILQFFNSSEKFHAHVFAIVFALK